MSFIWRGPEYKKQFESQMKARVKSACQYLTSAIKADTKQSGRLVYNPIGKRGKALKRTVTLRNFTHSRPGNPPYSQTNNLNESIAFEVEGLVGRVGSNIRRPAYPLYLELGTRRMAARPYLRVALIRHQATIRRILTRPMPADHLPPITSNQSRSGHLGRTTVMKPGK